MTTMAAFSYYLSFNFILVVGYLIFKISSRGSRATRQLALAYSTLALCLGVALLLPVLPNWQPWPPIVKVWAPSLRAEVIESHASRLEMAELHSVMRLPNRDFSPLLGLLLAAAVVRLSWGVRRLVGLRRAGVVIRRVGHAVIYMNPQIKVPLSFWLPGEASVMLPNSFVYQHQRLAIAHELQHHRQGDTRWVFVLWALRQLCFLNPFVFLWSRSISEVQEFACDEAVVDHGKVKLQAYTRGLVETAIMAFAERSHPVGATGMIFPGNRRLLSRRIARMSQDQSSLKRGPAYGWLAVTVFLVTGTAYASRGMVQDRRIEMAQAQTMAKQTSGTFPVTVNASVLKWLNQFLGTPEGRARMRQALTRLESFRPLVESKLQAYGVPIELMAVPIVESGYQNLAEVSHHGAGLWMFIRSTAQNFGLRVDETLDDRLNPPLETDAAMRLLQVNNLRFNDWQLSVLAYNVGDKKVQEGIDHVGSRDAWKLIAAGYEGDHEYLAKVMAAILVLRNPSSVE